MKDIGSLLEKLTQVAHVGKKYLPLLFCLLVLGSYGFVVYRVQVLNNEEPDTSAVTAQSLTAQVPKIDPTVLTQLKSLQDNSVSVKSLFDSARNNPFQE